MRKIVVSALLTLGLAGGLAAGLGVASADDGPTLAHGGLFPTKKSCQDAGTAAVHDGPFQGFTCAGPDQNGQYELLAALPPSPADVPKLVHGGPFPTAEACNEAGSAAVDNVHFIAWGCPGPDQNGQYELLLEQP